jgi:hypothetical protein
MFVDMIDTHFTNKPHIVKETVFIHQQEKALFFKAVPS